MQGKYLENNEIAESFSGIHRCLVWELWILHVPGKGILFSTRYDEKRNLSIDFAWQILYDNFENL